MTTLDHLAAMAGAMAGGPHPCAILGHRWVSIGGANCGCHDDACCSVPVHECSVCGDCDYGDNPEADDIRRECRTNWSPDAYID